jgi:serpin B
MPWPFTRKSTESISQEADQSSSSPSARFAFRLFRQLSSHSNTNVFFSPSSIMLCLAMVHELASGETRQSMAQALEIASLDAPKLAAEIALLKSAFRPREDAQVAFANSVWLSTHVQVAEELAAKLRELYESELATVDFGGSDAVPIINRWVNSKTRGKISKIVSQLSPLSALVATNAVYFRGVWVRPFEPEFTQNCRFITAELTKQLPAMVQGGTYSYYEDGKVQMVALPYKGGLSMYVVLPSVENSGGEFPRHVSSGSWESWIAKSKLMKGTIQLPRFKVDYDAQLKSALTALGMDRAFDENRAEFEAIRTNQPPVWIDQVVHRAMAEVNEAGTEAAAVTAVLMRAGSAMNQRPERRFSLIVDRPFLVVIRDDGTKTILFMGWIADPQ